MSPAEITALTGLVTAVAGAIVMICHLIWHKKG